MHELAARAPRGDGIEAALDEVFDRFDVVIGLALDALDLGGIGVSQALRPGRRARSARRLASRATRRCRGSAASAFNQSDFDADPLADQAALAEERAQFGSTCRRSGRRWERSRSRDAIVDSHRRIIPHVPCQLVQSIVGSSGDAIAMESDVANERFSGRTRQPGRAAGAGRCPVGRADPACRRQFPDQRTAHAARVHPCARTDQVGCGNRQPRSRRRSTPSVPARHPEGRARSRRGPARRAVSRSMCSRPAPAPAPT